jgi:hypothetical protein
VDTTSEVYTPSREALFWLEAIGSEWRKGGQTPEQHVARGLATGDNPVDEGLLRAMEEAGMRRVRTAIAAGIPPDLTARFIVALRDFSRLSDHEDLANEAKQAADRLASGGMET